MRFFFIVLMLVCLSACSQVPVSTPQSSLPFTSDKQRLDSLQQQIFRLVWDDADVQSGMVFESSQYWPDFHPMAVGATGFAIACLPVAVERGWISRDEARQRAMSLSAFLLNSPQRLENYGAFAHWLEPGTGRAVNFGGYDSGPDIVETSYLIAGLLAVRAYFDGSGEDEVKLRAMITQLWEDVDWNWFTRGEEDGLYWHWSQSKGFEYSFKILGFNECMITYILALASPTHPISRKAYDYWTSGQAYQPKQAYGYTIEAAFPNAGPLFLAHYSYMFLNPRHMADSFVTKGYHVRNVTHSLINRAYCLEEAPAANLYSEDFWGLTACLIKDGYQANEPGKDAATVAPTAAISSMPYVPHFAMQVLENLQDNYPAMWGKNGPYDAMSLRDDWISPYWLSLDQFPMLLMVENYRSGLVWELFAKDADVQKGLAKAGVHSPNLPEGFPEIVLPLLKQGQGYTADSYPLRRHPDTDTYSLPYQCSEAKEASFIVYGPQKNQVWSHKVRATKGSNTLKLPSTLLPGLYTLKMKISGREYSLPLRLV